MAKSVQVTKERLEKLTRILHLRALRKMLSKDPYVVPETMIEGNRGRVAKAVRVLMHHGLMHRCVLDETSPHRHYDSRNMSGYWPSSTFHDSLEEYAAAHRPFEFEDAVRVDLEKTIIYSFNLNNISLAGWREINKASLPQLAYMWIHKEKFLFIETEDYERGAPVRGATSRRPRSTLRRRG